MLQDVEFSGVRYVKEGARETDHRPPYTYLYLNKEFKSKSKWWWSVSRARHNHQHKHQNLLIIVVWVPVYVSRARVHTLTPNTDQHKHRHVTTPKGAKRLLKMACNKVCMTARCVYVYVKVFARLTTPV